MKGAGELLTLVVLAVWFLWRLRRSTGVNDLAKVTVARQDLKEGLEWMILGALSFVGAMRWFENSTAVGLALMAVTLTAEGFGVVRLMRGVLAGFAATNPPWREPFLGGNRAARRRFEREHPPEPPPVEIRPTEHSGMK
ncbi:MAG: hypothetical protein JF590_05185 [Gemmatimonadetes bacterium]|nr:hypothetical protein [Gemmatimonadota bacterium]